MTSLILYLISYIVKLQTKVKCAAIMKKRRGDHFMDYADVVETACQTGPAKLVKFSSFARYPIIISYFQKDG